MKRRTKLIILFVLLLVIALIPIGISASKTLTIPFLSDEEIAEANMKEKERALAEKEEFARTHNMNGLNSETSKIDSQNTDDPNLKEKFKKSEEEDKKRQEIINKLYPEEYKEILEESKKEQDTGLVEITKSPLKNYERKLYDLYLRILEQENLTGEENELLKEFVESNMYNIQKDNELKTRAEAVLNK